MTGGLPPTVRRRLKGAVWHDLTGVSSCFGQTWTVRTDDPELADLLRDLFAPLRSTRDEGQPTRMFSVLVPSDEGPGLVVRDASSVEYEGCSPGEVMSALVWCINRLLIEESTGHVLLHATAAAKNGEMLLLVGRPNSGKTTLLTGLLQRGYDYVTDEVVSVDESLWGTGFPKPLTINEGAWAVLDDLDPRSGGSLDRFHEQQWHLAAQHLAAVSPRGRISAVAFPCYRAEGATSIQALSAGEAMARLIPRVFAPKDTALPLDKVRRVAALAGAVATYGIVYSDRDAACEQLLQ